MLECTYKFRVKREILRISGPTAVVVLILLRFVHPSAAVLSTRFMMCESGPMRGQKRYIFTSKAQSIEGYYPFSITLEIF